MSKIYKTSMQKLNQNIRIKAENMLKNVKKPLADQTTTKSKINQNYLYDISRYFRDFLDTDFKRQKLPKRQIQRTDREGNLTGIPIFKYPSLISDILKKLNKPIGMGLEFNIVRGRYTVPINSQLSDLIEKQIDSIPPELLSELLDQLTILARTVAKKYPDDPEYCKTEVMDKIESNIIQTIVIPLLTGLERHFDKNNFKGLETIFDIKDELGMRLVTDVEEAIGAALNTAIVNDAYTEFDQLISDLLSVDSVRTKCLDYFHTFIASDLFNEFHELRSTTRIKENMDVYLYIGAIYYKKISYPLFYLPINISFEKNYKLRIDPLLYVNKKAIDYISQEKARAEDRSPRSRVNDRIIYLSQDQSIIQIVQSLADSWASDFFLGPPIDYSKDTEQKSKSGLVAMSNQEFFAVFDKSDESLVNDYEELLNMLDKNDPIAIDFRNIVDNFLSSDPVSVANLVDNEWDDYSIEERLVYQSPIPLNEEQRCIQSALRKEDCRFVAVQGPPGTGKSHTITAIAFDEILNNKNVLILSDKKEALDVVEDKITQTLNSVRLEDNFQNPILRLGKSSNTYHKIISTQAIDKIKTHHRVANAKKDELKDSILSEEEQLKENIKQTATLYEEIDIQDIYELIEAEKQLGDFADIIMPLLFDSVSNQFLKIIRDFIILLTEVNRDILPILQAATNKQSISLMQELLDTLLILNKAPSPNPKALRGLQLFNKFEESDIENLREILQLYEECRWPVFGFMFVNSRCRTIDQLANDKLSLSDPLNLHKKYSILKSAYEYICNLHQFLFQQGDKGAFLRYGFQSVSRGYTCDIEQSELLLSFVKVIMDYIEEEPLMLQQLYIDTEDVSNWVKNATENHSSILYQAIKIQSKFEKISDHFLRLPQYNYIGEKSKLESLHTRVLADTIDERVIDFHESKRTTAKAIRDIIRKKQKFPIDRFDDLKSAFPCIIANIRNYAEYMPLVPNLFDLIIIDEASQVSIAQAFPAMLRAKKMLVLGDTKQFSNVKTTNASKEINNQYVTEIKSNFIKKNKPDANILNRLEKFNIKTSILDFVEMIANYSILLKKHFRGYMEHISYSSKFFYRGQLQAVKIRGLPISDILEFSYIDHDKKLSLKGNVNELEADFILNKIEDLLKWNDPPSVGIITPFTDQQRYINKKLSAHRLGQKMFERLNLKCMTFDSCQGEERDYVFYSMVASSSHDRLYGIFPKGSAFDGNADEILRLQRLNVGFSRVKEKMHFVLSRSLEEYTGAIGEALRHYDSVLRNGENVPMADSVDPNSPMEAKLLHWIQQTEFYQKNYDQLEIVPQFPIGEYLKQLDPSYNHPAYRVDFLLKYRSGNHVYHILIEYDGFKEHFTNLSEVNAANYKHYYKAKDVEREKVLESYGYRMLRINRFNLGSDPVATLSERISQLTKDIIDRDAPHELVEDFHNMAGQVKTGERRICKRCGQPKMLSDFRDDSLITGYGRICMECKNTKHR